jgi:hypothetical protein
MIVDIGFNNYKILKFSVFSKKYITSKTLELS